MKENELSELKERERLEKAQKMKSTPMLNALLIGIVFGVVLYGVVNNNFGLLALIPLFIVFKMFNNSKND